MDFVAIQNFNFISSFQFSCLTIRQCLRILGLMKKRILKPLNINIKIHMLHGFMNLSFALANSPSSTMTWHTMSSSHWMNWIVTQCQPFVGIWIEIKIYCLSFDSAFLFNLGLLSVSIVCSFALFLLFCMLHACLFHLTSKNYRNFNALRNFTFRNIKKFITSHKKFWRLINSISVSPGYRVINRLKFQPKWVCCRLLQKRLVNSFFSLNEQELLKFLLKRRQQSSIFLHLQNFSGHGENLSKHGDKWLRL